MTTNAQRRPRQTDTSYPDRPDDAAARLLLTVEQAAGRLNVGRSTAYGLVQSGQLESVTVGRLRRIPSDAIAAFVDSLRRARA